MSKSQPIGEQYKPNTRIFEQVETILGSVGFVDSMISYRSSKFRIQVGCQTVSGSTCEKFCDSLLATQFNRFIYLIIKEGRGWLDLVQLQLPLLYFLSFSPTQSLISINPATLLSKTSSILKREYTFSPLIEWSHLVERLCVFMLAYEKVSKMSQMATARSSRTSWNVDHMDIQRST